MKTFKLDAEIGQKTQNVNFCGFQFRTIGPDSLEAFLKECAVGEKVKIEINSPGGSVIAGLAMANMIKNSKAHVIAHVVGIAASMASVVACACDEIQMEEAAFLMIHNPWTYTVGNANELRAMADQLDKIAEPMIEAYMSKFNGTRDDLKAMLDAETYLTAEEAFSFGLCTNVVEDTEQTQTNAEEGIDSTVNMYSSKLKQFASIKQSIKDLLAEETAEAETANEAKAEVVNEAEAVNETEMDAPEEKHTVTKDEAEVAVAEVKRNALQAFFNVK